MGRFLSMIANEPLDSPLGQIVLRQLAVHRALGNRPDPETVARDSYHVFLGNMQRQELEIAELKAQQAQRRQSEIAELRSSVSSAAPRERVVRLTTTKVSPSRLVAKLEHLQGDGGGGFD